MLSSIQPMVQSILQKDRQQRSQVGKGLRHNFTEGDFVFVAREDFSASEKLLL